MGETSRNQSCMNFLKPQDGYPIERKVTDVSGRLGSLYDASTDNLIDRHSVQRVQRKIPRKRTICRLFSGDQSRELISFLRDIDFNDALRQSISLQMVTPSGTSRLIEYNQPIDERTRFLYYAYRARKEKLNVKARKADRIIGAPLNPTEATHMITKILWGIEILCIIQIPNNQSVNEIDQLLRYICDQLKNNQNPIQLNNTDRRLINQLTNITIFGSETCVDQPNTSILTVLNRIQDWQNNTNFHQPLIYTMQPLRWLYNSPQFSEPCYLPSPTNPHIARVEMVINRIKNQIKDLSEFFQNFPTNFSSATLHQRLKDFQQQYRFLLDSQDNLQERLKRALVDVRRQRVKPTVLDHIIADQRYECLRKTEIEKFRTSVEQLFNKSILIRTLKDNQIEYVNAFDIRSNQTLPTTIDDIDAILKRAYSNENVLVILWYSSDRLRRIQQDRWQQIYQELTSERQNVAQRINLVYVDFTYFEQRLESFIIVKLSLTGTPIYQRDPTSEIEHQPSRTVPSSPPTKKRAISTSPPIRSPSPSIRPPSSLIRSPSPSIRPPSSLIRSPSRSSSPPIEINVLLLGETGVGKSTFINAFVNYLKFDNLQQAERGEPVVLIPVSFLITIGNQFEEFIVKFGNIDSNENHEHQGQSVTQQCRSYVFDLNDRLRLRLIDTPGIGDTRGINQDIKNIDHILNYINNLSHLNAICLLLKPNASRLNIFFRSCINQLLTYLTPIGYNNIIFCFTNARATFYAPGDTGPLLRKMLNDQHLNDIPFKKENTFCFDSESFRYLAARKCGIDFDDYQRQEYISSWNTSVTESIRLLNFIQRCQPYYADEWISPRKTTLDICMLARPLMETLRLIIYNSKLNDVRLNANQIILNSNPIDIDMCTHCAQINLVDLGPFWLTQYQPPIVKTNANQHRHCPTNGRHFFIECLTTYGFMAQSAGLKNERWQSSFRNFLYKCDRLHHFLRQQGPSTEDDPFLPILERFLDEEQQISQIRNINSDMNRRVREVLNTIKRIRQENSQKLFGSNERLSLNQVYQIINELIAIPTVRKQVDNIKRSRQLRMKQNEYIIPTNSIKNRIFT
ncbi:unnamed protein product [Rotaria sordida]|uniref:Septin-type G domain-containing protein n=1 Tax=Rotaria sordida TaxID=392033 RepID=A0A814MEY4_9BILA|nr:unnamed protein product [Rotaria sordida]CAF3698256.1 unnamed protein product [Rotaria sordida]